MTKRKFDPISDEAQYKRLDSEDNTANKRKHDDTHNSEAISKKQKSNSMKNPVDVNKYLETSINDYNAHQGVIHKNNYQNNEKDEILDVVNNIVNLVEGEEVIDRLVKELVTKVTEDNDGEKSRVTLDKRLIHNNSTTCSAAEAKQNSYNKTIKRKFDAHEIFSSNSTNGYRAYKKQKITEPVKRVEEGNVLRYSFMVPLNHMASVTTIIHLWVSKTTLDQIKNLFNQDIEHHWSCDSNKGWQDIACNIDSQIFTLALPQPVTKQLVDISKFIGKALYNWIQYNDKYVLNTEPYSEYSAAHYIDNIKWTSRGRINYQQTAKNILLKEDNGLSDDHKYKFACTYCLEDYIATLAPQVISKWYLESITISMQPMVYFWTSYITNNAIKLENSLRWHNHDNRANISINEYIFSLLISNISWVKNTINDVPIQYMWNKLTLEEKEKNIMPAIKAMGDTDLIYCLLSQLNHEQQKNIFKDYNCSKNILEDLFNNWLWGECFLPTAYHVLNVMHEGAYCSILEKIMGEINKYGNNDHIYSQYKSILMGLWQETPNHLKDFIFEHDDGRLLQNFIIFRLSLERDIDIIKLILSDTSIQQKKEIILKEDGIKKCASFIINDQWDLLDLFIKHTLSEEDINELKQKLIKDKGREIAVNLLEQETLDKIEYFLHFSFKSDEEIIQFKQTLAYTKCKTILKSIVTNNKVDFTELENHLKWCASNNLSIVNKFKAEIPKLYSGRDLIFELIKLDKYELLEKTLNWCFLNNQQQIDQFKNSMYKDDYLSYFVRSVVFTLINKDNFFQLLNKFVDWCFINKQEVQEFKTWILYPQEDACSLCVGLLDKYQFELADKFINWCVTSPEEITKFKNRLMLSKDMEYIIDPACEDVQDNLQLLVKWFNPSKEAVEEFKKLFSEEDCPDNFCKFLDEFIESKNSLTENNEEMFHKIYKMV